MVPGQPDGRGLQRRYPGERGIAPAAPVGGFPELYHAPHAGERGWKIARLITNGCGYIGSHTCLEMLTTGYGIVVPDSCCNVKPKAPHANPRRKKLSVL